MNNTPSITYTGIHIGRRTKSWLPVILPDKDVKLVQCILDVSLSRRFPRSTGYILEDCTVNCVEEGSGSFEHSGFMKVIRTKFNPGYGQLASNYYLELEDCIAENSEAFLSHSAHVQVKRVNITGNNVGWDVSDLHAEQLQITGNNAFLSARGLYLKECNIKGDDAFNNTREVSLVSGDIEGKDCFKYAENVFIYSPSTKISSLYTPANSIIVVNSIDSVAFFHPDMMTRLFCVNPGPGIERYVTRITKDEILTDISPEDVQARAIEFANKYKA